MPEIQTRRTVGQRKPFIVSNGAAAKYLSASGACKSAARVSAHPQVEHSENHADSTGRQRVIGTVRSGSDEPTARNAGAQEVIVNSSNLVSRVKALAPEGVDHIVEVAFGANVDADVEVLKNDGSIATYATDNATPKIPF